LVVQIGNPTFLFSSFVLFVGQDFVLFQDLNDVVYPDFAIERNHILWRPEEADEQSLNMMGTSGDL